MGEFQLEWFHKQLRMIGKSQADLSRALNIDKATAHHLLNGRRKIKISEIETFARFLEVNAQELLTRAGAVSDSLTASFGPGLAQGTGGGEHTPHSRNSLAHPTGGDIYTFNLPWRSGTIEDKPGGGGEDAGAGPRGSDQIAFTLTAVPELDVRGGAGGGGEAQLINTTDEHGNTTSTEITTDLWGLPAKYAGGILSINPEDARIIQVQGDSMEPTLRSGDRVMIDTAAKEPSPAGIFALWDGGGVIIKRIERTLNSQPTTLRVRSDNPLHDDQEIPLLDVTIIGRVVWAARMM